MDPGSSSEWLWLPAPGSATGLHSFGGTDVANAATAAVPADGGLGAACRESQAVAMHRGCGEDRPAAVPCAGAAGEGGSAGSSHLQSAASANSEETHVSAQHMTAMRRSAEACAASAVEASSAHTSQTEHDPRQLWGQAEADHVGNGASGSLLVGHGPPCMHGAAPSRQAGKVADRQQSTRSWDGWHLQAEPKVRRSCGGRPSPHGLIRRFCAPPVSKLKS